MATILTLSHKLEAAGLDRDKAEAVATEIGELYRGEAASKADLIAVAGELRADIKLLKWMVGGNTALLVVILGRLILAH